MAQQDGARALIEQASARELAAHPYWRALLRYAPGGQASEIVSPDFFNAANGARDPEAELAATLAAFFALVPEQADTHAQCRFPARYLWLRKMLDWGGSRPPSPVCRSYQTYTARNTVASLSLVYATGYLSNPASFYGHILLKLNSPSGSLSYDLLDQSVNFGAVVPPRENPVLYMLKGLFGGYDAVFSHQRFYSFNHAYAENELRDMWEYVLDLNPSEVEQIVAHSWELLGKKYVYYFFHDNCAYRMAQLLGMVIDDPLLPRLPYSLPGTVFERLVSRDHGGRPLVREVRRIPSRQTMFHARYEALGSEERETALELITNGLEFRDARYERLPVQSRVAVADMLLDYYQYRIVADRGDSAAQSARQYVLVERAQLPGRPMAQDAQAGDTQPPHAGPLPLMLRLGALHNPATGDGLSLRARPASYDHVSLDAGRIPHSELAMFDLKVLLARGQVQLRSLHVVSVENFNNAHTPLPGDGGWAWKMQAGLESHDLACNRCTVPRVTGGLGKAFTGPSNSLLFGMLDLSAQSSHEGSGTLSITPRAGAVAAVDPAWKSYLSAGRRIYLSAGSETRSVLQWDNRFGNSRQWDVRLSYLRDGGHEIEAAVSLYW